MSKGFHIFYKASFSVIFDRMNSLAENKRKNEKREKQREEKRNLI